MKRAVSFVLFLSLEATIFCQNLVVNSGFETWGTINKPTGWTNSQACLKDSAFIVSGSYSCRQGSTASKDLGQKIAVSQGKQYRFSFHYNTDTTNIANGCRVWCEWLDENKDPIDDPSSISELHSGFLKSAAWQQFSTTVTSPDNAHYFYLLVRTLPNSITYWDDFIFEEDIVSGDPENRFPDITLYPNPACDYLIINTLYNIQHIDIQDFTGRIVWSSDFSGEIHVTVPVSALHEGMYIARIKTTDKIITRKFIKKAN